MKHLELTYRILELVIKDKDILSVCKNAIIKEDIDDVGYFIYFNSKNCNHNYNFSIPQNIIGKNKDGKIIVGFTFYFTNNILDCLEGYTFGTENWPDDDDDIILEIIND